MTDIPNGSKDLRSHRGRAWCVLIQIDSNGENHGVPIDEKQKRRSRQFPLPDGVDLHGQSLKIVVRPQGGCGIFCICCYPASATRSKFSLRSRKYKLFE